MRLHAIPKENQLAQVIGSIALVTESNWSYVLWIATLYFTVSICSFTCHTAWPEVGRAIYIQTVHISLVKVSSNSVNYKISTDWHKPLKLWIVFVFVFHWFSFFFYCCFQLERIYIKMIESVNLPSIHTSGQYNKNSETLINNNYRLKFPFQIKSVEPIINASLLKDFTGKQIFRYFSLLFQNVRSYIYLLQIRTNAFSINF